MQTNNVFKHHRNGSTASSLSVVDLTEEDKPEWNYYSGSQNLSSVLNDPNIGRSASEQIFTKDWGAYFTENATGSNRHHLPTHTSTAIITNNIATSLSSKSDKREYFDGYLRHLRRRIRHQKQLLCQLESLDSNGNRLQDNKSAQPILNGTGLHALDHSPAVSNAASKLKPISLENFVPSVFLKEDFHLEDYSNFKEVLSQNSEVEALLNDRLSLKHHGPLFTKEVKNLEHSLTDHLDRVEEHLAKQISVRFRDFFHIMSAMDSVMEQLGKTIKDVTLVRNKCAQLQKTLVYPSLKNIQLTKRRENLQMVYEKIRVMSTVHETQPTIQFLLSSSDYVGALDLISTTQEVFNQDLAGFNSFRHLRSQLSEIRNVIDQMMQEDFVKFTTQEWNRPLTEVEKLYKVVPSSNDLTIEFKEEDDHNNNSGGDDRLSCMILGMLRVQRLNFIEVFKDEACTTIKAIIKQTIIETLSKEDNFESISPFDQINELDFRKWKQLLSQTFDNLFIILKRIESIHNVIVRTIESVTISEKDTSANKSFGLDDLSSSLAGLKSESTTLDCVLDPSSADQQNFLPETEASKLNSQLKECFNSICDFCHNQCASILESRSKESSFSKISFNDFVELVKLIENFTFKCERVCDRRSASLKLVLQAQTNSFVTRFHDERKKKLMSLLDIEQWKSYDNVSPDFQQIVTDLIDYNCSIHELSSHKRSESNDSKIGQKSPGYLVVNNEKFVIVSSVITLVNMVIEYCTCATEIQAISADLLTRLLDLLRQFNARVSQLVLCAGALQVAGLKTITSRNLLISSRCLTLVLILIPYLKNHFNQILPSKHKNMLKHFDDTKKSYVEHIQKINDKVVTVVKELLVININKWEAKPPVPSPQFKAISQHLQRLYLNIEDTLPEEDLNQLFLEIHEIFKQQLRKQLAKLKIVNDGGPQHGLVTQELTFYKQSLKVTKNDNFSWDDLWTKA